MRVMQRLHLPSLLQRQPKWKKSVKAERMDVKVAATATVVVDVVDATADGVDAVRVAKVMARAALKRVLKDRTTTAPKAAKAAGVDVADAVDAAKAVIARQEPSGIVLTGKAGRKMWTARNPCR